MEIALCFGAFCHIMLFFANNRMLSNQYALIGRIVWSIDPYNAILIPKENVDFDDETKRFDPDSYGYDSSEIARILSGERVLKLKKTDTFSISQSKENFIKAISPWFTPEAMVSMILILRHIIEEDSNINNHELNFKGCFGVSKKEFLCKNEYEFYNLMFCALRYTTSVNMDTEKDIVKKINDSIVKNSKNKKRKYTMSEGNEFFEYLTSFTENVKKCC